MNMQPDPKQQEAISCSEEDSTGALEVGMEPAGKLEGVRKQHVTFLVNARPFCVKTGKWL
jgi:hypothetical protein